MVSLASVGVPCRAGTCCQLPMCVRNRAIEIQMCVFDVWGFSVTLLYSIFIELASMVKALDLDHRAMLLVLCCLKPKSNVSSQS